MLKIFTSCWLFLLYPPLFFFYILRGCVYWQHSNLPQTFMCALSTSLKNEPTDFFTSECLELKLPAEGLPASTSHHTTARAFTDLPDISPSLNKIKERLGDLSTGS